jgi:hypothetical protein
VLFRSAATIRSTSAREYRSDWPAGAQTRISPVSASRLSFDVGQLANRHASLWRHHSAVSTTVSDGVLGMTKSSGHIKSNDEPRDVNAEKRD